ncbi:MAG: YidC/Oxa1 family membrane protein insertase [Clostridia bacterium]|nr:YidC/Oxa1 family membrane protein insertase [Clostridia bacterium]
MTALLRNILEFVQDIVNNYGWAVIIFSLFIKAVLLPLDYKSRKSMRAMTALNPKMEELKKKYANDQEKLNQKMSELYKKNKVNPLSGCLPMLIQLPILFMMFSVMRNTAAELQLDQMYKWVAANFLNGETGELLKLDNEAVQAVLQAVKSGEALKTFGDPQGWLWIKSVFQPDSFMKTVIPTMEELSIMLQQYGDKITPEVKELLTLYASDTNQIASAVDLAVRENCGFTTFNLFLNWIPISFPKNWSVYVNGCFALPILAGVTQFLQTKLTPTSADTSSQKGGTGAFMKWFFPIFSVWICISSTAAFAIYWVFVNIWSIVTNFAINKYLDAKDKKTQVVTEKEALQP